MPRKATEAAAQTKKPAAKKTTTKKTTTTRRTRKTTPVVLEWEHVATRAYYIHLGEGGDPTENWLRAERELLAA